MPLPAQAAPAEPRHTRGGAGGAGRAGDEPSWHRQKVRVPKSVWGEGRYSPGAVAWHAQATALQSRPERCRASVATLAGWMGDSKRTGERYLAELHAPGQGGVPEMTTIRHTSPGGDGETAERFTRPLAPGEHYAYVPVLAAKTLRHPLFVLYCAITYAVATKTPVTAAELAQVLGVTEMTARRMVAELEGLGWITVHRRAGAHGRHLYEVHDQPLHLVPETAAEPSSDGGSGASADGGSLATKEDPGLTDERTSTHHHRGIRRRRGDRKWAGEPVENPDNPSATPVASVASVADGTIPPALRPAAPRSYDGPPLTLAPRIHRVLEPVRHELADISPYLLRRIGREIGAQLDTGTPEARLVDRLTRRRATTEPVQDIGRWLLGAALVRHGCPRPDCESGVIWDTGTDCETCTLNRQVTDARQQREQELQRREEELRDEKRQQEQRPVGPDAVAPAPTVPPPAHTPPAGHVGPPPGGGGWRALVARERPADAAHTYRHRWTGDHAALLPDTPTGT